MCNIRRSFAGIESANLLAGLRGLVKRGEYPAVRSIEALCVDLAGGNRDAGAMLHHLLKMWPKAGPKTYAANKGYDPHGWVYKSYRDWWEELRIKRHHLPGLNTALAAAGVEMRVFFRHGVNVSHYALDMRRFVKRLCRVLRTGVLALARSFAGMGGRRLPGRPAVDCRDGGQPIQQIPPQKNDRQKTTVVVEPPVEGGESAVAFAGERAAYDGIDGGDGPDDVEVMALVRYQIPDPMAAALVQQHGRARVNEVLQQAAARGVSAGWIVKALAGGWTWPEKKRALSIAEQFTPDAIAASKYAAFIQT